MKKNKQEIAAEVIQEFPKADNRTVARVLCTRHPRVFLSVEAARTTVRHLRGARGRSSPPPSIKEHIKPIGWQKEVMPVGQSKTRFELNVTGKQKVLVISDLHVPYHDHVAVKVALDYGKRHQVDTILINGDFGDFYAVSRHDKDPTRILADEITECRKMLAHIRGRFQNARIIFKVGNHEDRMERFLVKNAPVLLGCSEFRVQDILHLEKYDIEFVPSLGLTWLGKLPVYHGHELPKGMSSPVNPARGIWMRLQESGMCGHWHRSSTHFEKTGVKQKVKGCWSLGCLCDMQPEYAPVNKWSHGFAVVTIDDDGNYDVDNKTIIGGIVK